MTLSSVTSGNTVQATDVNQFKLHLEGDASSTAPFYLRQSAGNFTIRLSENAGATKITILDSDGVEVGYINSDGLMATNRFITPTSGSPSQTTIGELVYDSTNKRLTVGNGTSRDSVGLSVITSLSIAVMNGAS